MIGIHASETALYGILAIGLDVLVKATALIVLAAAVTLALNGPRRLLWRSAVWNALLVALAVLPLAAITFPRLRVHCLPALPHPAVAAAENAGVPTPERAVAKPVGDPVIAARSPARIQVPDRPKPMLPSTEPPTIDTKEATLTQTPSPETGVTSSGSRQWVLWIGCGLGVYLAGIGVLLIRLLVSLADVQRLRRTASVLDDVGWVASLNRWQERLGINQRVTLAVSPSVNVPLAFGWLQPTVLIPEALVDVLDQGQRDAVLLHELAHVRRQDYPWQILLKLMQAVYWPHPLVWAVSRSVTTVREAACDDLCAYHAATPQEYRATLVRVAANLVHRPAVSLGIAMARSTKLAGRLERLDGTRGTGHCLAGRSTRMLAATLALMTVFAIGPLELTRRTARAEKPSEPAATRPAPAGGETPAEKPSLDFRVVDKDSGEPLADAALRVRVNDAVRTVKTDKNGRYRVELDNRHPSILSIRVHKPTYVPMVVGWSEESDPAGVPESHTLRLEPGSPVGGVVRDQDGRPVEGATGLVMTGQNDGRDRYNLWDYPVKTGADGRWVCDAFPRKIGSIQVRFEHPDYATTGITYQDSGDTMEQLRKRIHVTVMRKPPVLTGRVLDEKGSPLPGATVGMRTNTMNDKESKRATTNDKGEFRLVYTGAVQSHTSLLLTATSKDRAPDRKRVPLNEPIKPLELQLGLGRTLRGRITDMADKPLADVTVTVKEWRGFHPLEWRTQTDNDGRFIWQNAPTDGVVLSARKSGYLDGVFNTGSGDAGKASELTIRLAAVDAAKAPPETTNLRVHGSVVDAETGRPIPRFEVIPGMLFETWTNVHWERELKKTCADGTYEYTFDRSFRGRFLKIEVDGYAPGVSKKYIGNEGDVVLDFRLKRQAGPHGIVRSPDGKPVAGALVALATSAYGGGLRFQNSRLTLENPAIVTQTDAEGRFSFPAQSEDWFLVAVHDDGYREMTAATLTANSNVALEPWARVEGTLKVGGKPVANEFVVINYVNREAYSGFDPDLSRIDYWYEVATDANGHFQMDKLPRGDASIAHGPKSHNVDTRNGVPVALHPGQTVQLALGEPRGRPVIGKAVLAPELPGPVDWTKAAAALRSTPPPEYPAFNGDQTAYGKARAAFYATEAGRQYWRYERYSPVTLAADGSFRIEQVMAGKYAIEVLLRDPENAQKKVGAGTLLFDVPEMPDGRSSEPLNVGELKIGPPRPKVETPAATQTAPAGQ